MIRIRSLIPFLCVFLALVCTDLAVRAQSDTAAGKAANGKRMKSPADTGNRAVIRELERLSYSDTSLVNLLVKLEDLTMIINNDLSVLKRGFDTLEISSDIPGLEEMLAEVRTNLARSGTTLNMRNLYSEKMTLQQIDRKLKSYQEKLQGYGLTLVNMEQNLKESFTDPYFRNVPEDPELREKYFSQLDPLLQKYRVADTLVDNYIKSIGKLHNRVSASSFVCADLQEEVDILLQEHQARYFSRDINPIWTVAPGGSEKSMAALWLEGFRKSSALLSFFLNQNINRILITILFAIIFFCWVVHDIRALEKAGNTGWRGSLHFLDRSPAMATLLLYFTLQPFLVSNPPTGAIQISWTLMLLAVTYIRWPDWPADFREYWLGIVLLFILFGMDGYLRESNTPERLLLLVLNLFSVWLGLRMYAVVSRDKTRYHALMSLSIIIFIVMNVLAVAMNASGRLQMCRTLSNSSVLSITLLLALQIIREIFLEFIFLNLEARKHSKFSSVMEFERFKSGFGKLLRVVTLVLWVMAFAWSLNFLDLIMEKTLGFMRQPRFVGEFEFTFVSIMIFLLTVWIAFTIANIVNFLLRSDESGFASGRQGRTGSWVLLLRVAIISAGFLIAIAAAGIPMDKLTIILGSLGVGIGFGLQNIVSNLMSGIMLAFEKPMQSGDVIELGNQLGTVKEIGIRSSKIATYDGAVIIVPNGEFVTQRLINWTHDNNNFRRVELIVGVRYGSDIRKVRQVIDDVIRHDPDVAVHPPPVILLNELASSSVNIRVLVWTSEFDRWVAMKGRLLEEIYAAFSRNGIEIPFPQTDLHLRSVSPDAAKVFSRLPDPKGPEQEPLA